MDAERNQKLKSSQDTTGKAHRNLVWEHRFLWMLVIAILGLWGYHYVLGRVDRKLREVILVKLAQKYPRHLIQLDHAHLEEGRAILIEGLEIMVPTPEGPREVVRIQRLIAKGEIQLLDLVRGKIQIRDVRIDGLELAVWPMSNGQWSIETLSSSEPLTSDLPPVDVRSGFLRIGHSSAKETELICHDLKAQLRIFTNTETQAPYLHLASSLSSSYFKRIQAEASLSTDKKQWFVEGEAEDLDISNRLVGQLPAQLQAYLQNASGFECRSRAGFQVGRDANGAISFEVRGNFHRGRLEHPQLPYLLEDMQGEIFCRNGLLQIRKAKASSGDANFAVEADIEDFSTRPKLNIHAHIENLALDSQLHRALPESAKQIWNRFSVGGHVDADIHAKYDGAKWIPDAVIHCRDVSVEADIFPYPVRDIQGSFQYKKDVIEGKQLVGKANGQTVRGSLRMEKADPRWLIDLQVASDGPVAIEPKLISALTMRGEPQSGLETFVHTLQPSGSVHLKGSRFVRSKEDPTVLHRWLELQFYSSSIQYTLFPYPIFDIQGQVVVDDNTILLKDFTGRHDSARIECHGECQCSGKSVAQLRLDFDALSVPLQEGLERALPPQVRDLWNQVQPSGTLDRVQIVIAREQSEPMDIRVEITEAGLVDSQTGRSLSLRPTALPYLLNDISCHLVYRPGVLEVKQMSGKHDFSIIKAEGNCRLRNDGTWGASLTWLPQTRLIVDQSLLMSIPETLRQPLISLDYRGPVNVGGWTYFETLPNTGQPVAKEWDLELDLEDGKLSGGTVATGVRGTVRLEGEYLNSEMKNISTLQLDSLLVRSIPVTNLQGRIAIVGDQLYFGREAKGVTLTRGNGEVQPASFIPSRGTNQPVSSAVANTSPSPSRNRLLDGKVLPSASQVLNKNIDIPLVDNHEEDIHASMMNGTVNVFGTGQISKSQVFLKMHLEKADFHTLLLDFGQNNITSNGTLYADAQFTGSLRNVNIWSGNGAIRLRDANLYELPVMAKLFRLLYVRPPDSGAFETADVQFRIDGDRFPLDQVALDGDVISLRGDGSINLRRELHLDLYTYVGRRGQLAALVGPLIGKGDSASLLRIEVDGTVDNPQVKRSLLGLDASLEQVFPEKSQSQANNPR